MKLTELYIQSPKKGSYTDYLKDQGVEIPELKGTGYALVNYTPDKSTKYYDSLYKAEKDAPRGRKYNWQIIDVKTGKVEKEPEWWNHDVYYDYVKRKQY